MSQDMIDLNMITERITVKHLPSYVSFLFNPIPFFCTPVLTHASQLHINVQNIAAIKDLYLQPYKAKQLRLNCINGALIYL